MTSRLLLLCLLLCVPCGCASRRGQSGEHAASAQPPDEAARAREAERERLRQKQYELESAPGR